MASRHAGLIDLERAISVALRRLHLTRGQF